MSYTDPCGNCDGTRVTCSCSRGYSVVSGENNMSKKELKTSIIYINNYKDTGLGGVVHDLGFSHEEGNKIFEYEEYLNATIIVDENLNIIGGKVHRHEK